MSFNKKTKLITIYNNVRNLMHREFTRSLTSQNNYLKIKFGQTRISFKLTLLLIHLNWMHVMPACMFNTTLAMIDMIESLYLDWLSQ